MIRLRQRGVRGLCLVAAIGMTITGLGAAGPATAQALAAISGSWPQLEGNAAHTGDEPGENSINAGKLSAAWTAPLPTRRKGREVRFWPRQGILTPSRRIRTAAGSAGPGLPGNLAVQLCPR
jgi:hypothetical protein